MSSFVCFGEELDRALMLEYSGDLMRKLVAKLQSTSHRMVQEESITAIAVIAGVIETDFSQYYDGMMPLLKSFVMNATASKKRKDIEKVASDNAVAALLMLAKHHEAHCPPEIGIANCWMMIVNKLP